MADQLNEEEKQKLEEAKRALEGEEHTKKREETEKKQAQESELKNLSTRLEEIKQEKTKLELAWIDLDTAKKAIRQALDPILAKEKAAENEEISLEADEARIGVPEEKHKVEEQRWAIQAKRQEIEKRKWVEEKKMVEIDKKTADHTAIYRKLLDEEDGVSQRLAELRGVSQASSQ
jgi:hypothetical protein